MENFLEVRGVHKSFGGVQALKGVDLIIKEGEVHCLAGENGCGKSTIIKIISGFYKADAGTIMIQGKTHETLTPTDAIRAGIQVIYQDFSVFPNLTVMENLALNQVVANKKKFVSKSQYKKIALEAMSKIDFHVDLETRVENLPVADKQLIAISRALLDNAKMIIMDEPTTALTKKEVERLFSIVNKLKSHGVTILFVSHKLAEVFEISDRITIFRSGENVISTETKELNDASFAYYMTGRHFENVDATKTTEAELIDKSEVVMSVDKLSAPGFSDVSFDLHKGEILGITGQLGSGRTEISLALFGLLKPASGSIKVKGKTVKIKSVDDAMALGIALVPEDRLTEGLFLPRSILTNITVTRLKALVNRWAKLNIKKQTQESLKLVKDLNVKTDDHNLAVRTLSGGNQQKVLLARWLANKPDIVVLNGPTVGVDIGAKYDIHALLRSLAKEGISVIIVSDDLVEVISVCDRVIVVSGGRITGEMEKSALTEEALTSAVM